MIKKIHEKIKKHRWDESLVVGVMIIATVGVLIMLAGYSNIVGFAGAGNVPTKENVLGMLSGSKLVVGSTPGTLHCNSVCNVAKLGQCIRAWESETPIECDQTVTNTQYQCVCADVERIVAPVPEVVEGPECEVNADCAKDVCYNGQCVDLSCEDTDGVDITTKGSASALYPDGSEAGVLSDVCQDASHLVEAICLDGSATFFPFPIGCDCEDGICTSEPTGYVPCMEDGDCASGVCNIEPNVGLGLCKEGCVVNSDCASNKCVYESSAATSGVCEDSVACVDSDGPEKNWDIVGTVTYHQDQNDHYVKHMKTDYCSESPDQAMDYTCGNNIYKGPWGKKCENGCNPDGTCN